MTDAASTPCTTMSSAPRALLPHLPLDRLDSLLERTGEVPETPLVTSLVAELRQRAAWVEERQQLDDALPGGGAPARPRL